MLRVGVWMRYRQAKKIRGRVATSKNEPYRMSTWRRAARKLRLNVVRVWIPGQDWSGPYVIKEISWQFCPANPDAVIGYDPGKGDDKTVWTAHRLNQMYQIDRKDLAEIPAACFDHIQRRSDEVNEKLFHAAMFNDPEPRVTHYNSAARNETITASVGTYDDIRKRLIDLDAAHERPVTHFLFLRSVVKRIEADIEVNSSIDRRWDVIKTLNGIPFEVFETYEEMRQRAMHLDKFPRNRVMVFDH